MKPIIRVMLILEWCKAVLISSIPQHKFGVGNVNIADMQSQPGLMEEAPGYYKAITRIRKRKESNDYLRRNPAEKYTGSHDEIDDINSLKEIIYLSYFGTGFARKDLSRFKRFKERRRI